MDTQEALNRTGWLLSIVTITGGLMGAVYSAVEDNPELDVAEILNMAAQAVVASRTPAEPVRGQYAINPVVAQILFQLSTYACNIAGDDGERAAEPPSAPEAN